MKNFIKKNLLGIVTTLCLFLGTSLILIGQQNIFPQAEWNGTWDNTQYLDNTFWANTPNSGDIIYALFGSGDTGSAYTTNRSGRNSGQCDLANMQVTYIGPGTGTIPQQLTGNTIYVLTGGNYITTGTIFMSGCSAIIGETGNITLYSETGFTTAAETGAILSVIGKQYIIIDHIAINGSGDGRGNSHSSNYYGIFIYNSAKSNTINNSQTYNNNIAGIYYSAAFNNTIDNSQSYNNLNYGIYYNLSDNNIINNSQFYINEYGIYYTDSDNNTTNNNLIYNNEKGILYTYNNTNNSINNSQIYNNIYGLAYADSRNNILNNSQIYNNSNKGINYNNNSRDNILNNSQIYNNRYYGIDFITSTSTGNKYYGTLKLFDNPSGNTGGSASLVQGTGTYYATLGRNTGTLDIEGTMSRDYITNPKNANGDYMLSRSETFSNIMLGSPYSNFTQSISYSYGSGILTQIQPVKRRGTTDIIASGSFTPGNYIGSNIAQVTGNLLGINTSTSIDTLTVTGTSTNPLIITYSLFGNLTTFRTGQNKNTSTGITLSAGVGIKRIITQLYGTDYFATHFQKDTTRILSCLNNWNNDNFITGGFWDLNPDSENIICALYGSGQGDNTAYTTNRSGRNSGQCDLANMQVTYIGPGTGTIPQQLTGNTIYVLTGGNYITTGTIFMSGCSSILGQTENTYIYSSGTLGASSGTLHIHGNKTIIDNIKINGKNDGLGGTHTGNSFGINVLSGRHNLTINNIESFNNLNHGIFTDELSHHILINNSKFYNNNSSCIYGFGGIPPTQGYITINNILCYNNSNGITLFSTLNTINNSQIFNNYNGISIIGSDNTINNTHIFNNLGYGITLGAIFIGNANYTNINNTKIYNNNYGISFGNSTGNKYFGNIYLFNNSSGDFDTGIWNTYFTQGTNSYFSSLGRTTGSIMTGFTMSRNYITNPKNVNGNYLLNRLTGFNNIKGTGNFNATQPISYSYGNSILRQAQPVTRSGSSLIARGTYNSSNYIGSDLVAINGSLSSSPTLGLYTNQTSFSFTFSSPITSNYLLSGNFTGSPKIGTLGTITTGITLTGEGYKTIILQLYTGNLRATHFGITTTLDTISPTLTGKIASGTAIISGQYYNTTGAYLYFTDTNLSGITKNSVLYTGSSPLFITGDGTYTILVTDYAGNSTGITFTIDTIPPIFTGTTHEGIIISGSNAYVTSDITLSWYDINISGMTIAGAASYTSTTNGSKLLTGEGTYYFTITDKVGFNTGITFSITQPLIASIIIQTGNLKQNGSNRYSSGQVRFTISYNKSANFIITGFSDILSGITSPTLYGRYLTGTDGQKIIYANFWTGTLPITSQTITNLYLDTTAPTVTPAAIPGNNTSGDYVTLSRVGIDGGIGVSGYYYDVSNTGTFTTILKSGFTTSTTVNIYNYDLISSGTYYRRIKGLDKLGNLGGPMTGTEFYYTITLDLEPDSFSFSSISNAIANKAYMSNTVTIAGLTSNAKVLASIDNGALYISGILVGTTGYVQNGWPVKIELISSPEIGTRVSSTLTIGSQEGTFRVTTEEEEEASSTLSNTTKLDIATIFNTIADLYEDDKNKQIEFMTTFQSMIEDVIDTLEDDNNLSSSEQRKLAILKYLNDLITDFIEDEDIVADDIYVAPNSKRYIIIYDDNKKCYTSPNFVSSNKCFPELSAMKSHINANNQKRDHTVDTSRATQVYTAPNGKGYKIQKTTSNKYFSYRFISPKYFNSLTEIKAHINKRNPKGQPR